MHGDIGMDSILSNSGTDGSDSSDINRMLHLLPASGNITCSVIERIEAELDFYEKISLVFLLYDNVDLALQHLKRESYQAQASGLGTCTQCTILSDWARSDRSLDWEEKFLEALCIVKNFYAVDRLGYNKDDIIARFLPENPDTALNVNLTRKALYIFCEKLSKQEEIMLIELIEDEIGKNKTPSYIRNELKCMETFLLYLMSQKHIFYQNGVKIVTKHLKAMDKCGLCDFLESLSSNHERFNQQESRLSDEDDNSSLSGSKRAVSIVSTTIGSEISAIDFYQIDPKNIGLCIIINQKNFYHGSSLKSERLPKVLENRIGTDVDRDRLVEAFGNYGFTVRIWENLDHLSMVQSIEHATKELVQANHSCFVLCILSHGLRGIVYGVDGVPVSIEEIHRKLQGKACKKLLNKPKILIIQACQGEETQEAVSTAYQSVGDVDSDGVHNVRKPTIPEISDTLIFKSTIPGFVSYRDRLNGSWFIQSLCRQLLQPTASISLFDVCLNVNKEVQKLNAPEGKAMQPEFSSTMKATPYLQCKPSARKDVAKLIIKRMVFMELLKEYLSKEFVQKFCASELLPLSNEI